MKTHGAISPKKGELATFKAMNDMGLTPHAIGRLVGRDPKTVKKYLALDIFDDPELKKLIERIKETELQDLHLIGAKARHRIHQLLDGGKTGLIETTAILDRSFQQKQLLQGAATENINVRTVVAGLSKELEELQAERAALVEEAEIAEQAEEKGEAS